MLLAIVLMNTGCSSTSDVVKNGDTVSVDYVGMYEDGKIFDTSYPDKAKDSEFYTAERPYEPLTFLVGSGQMIKGFDKAVVGMASGETKTVVIPPTEAYGERSELAIQQVAVKALTDAGIKVEQGKPLMIQGRKLDVLGFTWANNEYVIIDTNMPLAGKTLKFEITVRSISHTTKD